MRSARPAGRWWEAYSKRNDAGLLQWVCRNTVSSLFSLFRRSTILNCGWFFSFLDLCLSYASEPRTQAKEKTETEPAEEEGRFTLWVCGAVPFCDVLSSPPCPSLSLCCNVVTSYCSLPREFTTQWHNGGPVEDMRSPEELREQYLEDPGGMVGCSNCRANLTRCCVRHVRRKGDWHQMLRNHGCREFNQISHIILFRNRD